MGNPFSSFNLNQVLDMDQPHIDINLPLLEKRMAVFKSSLGKYTTINQQEVINRRNLHLQEIEKLRVERAQIERDIQNYRMKEIALIQQLEAEKRERGNAEESVAHSNRQLRTLQERMAEAEQDAIRLDTVLKNLKNSKEKEKRQLEKQASQIGRDVLELEQLLGIQVQGAGNDILTIKFKRLDPRDPDRTFSVTIDLSSSEYRVTEVSPVLPGLPTLLDSLNESKDLFAFLRRIRQAFLNSLEI
ncbi:hypothetical protein PIIN_00507 [Serendipita indica DSM 11827]|uniref:Kinetochore protein SPC25 n=1 Tax=Serendipita indica (strain DSM 11827) TaxID=1109443 RepID=G4U2N9_SERID|nr:hypothetical protein PIIN_00507 [Serendipita indica DSM 11827]